MNKHINYKLNKYILKKNNTSDPYSISIHVANINCAISYPPYLIIGYDHI